MSIGPSINFVCFTTCGCCHPCLITIQFVTGYQNREFIYSSISAHYWVLQVGNIWLQSTWQKRQGWYTLGYVFFSWMSFDKRHIHFFHSILIQYLLNQPPYFILIRERSSFFPMPNPCGVLNLQCTSPADLLCNQYNLT